MYYVGLDIGTSSLKTILIDEKKNILYENSYSYVIEEKQVGVREIDPDVWFQAAMRGLLDITENYDTAELSVIGVTGQMHTTVFLDDQGLPCRKAIMWTDLRTVSMVEPLREELLTYEGTRHIAKILSPGCPAINALWVKNKEPEVFSRVRKIMTPHDYLVYRLSGQYSADYCDASTSSLYDIQTKNWSSIMLKKLGIDEGYLGPLHASCDVVGTLRDEVKELLKLSHDVRVIAGTGDNPANAVAMGILDKQEPVISLGTSGVIIMPKEDGDFEGKGKNVLFSAKGTSFVNVVQGTVRSAGGTHKWWIENIVESSDMASDQDRISESELGNNTILFFPHITGDKIIYHDIEARGAFLGLNASSKRSDMTLAVLEGVSFALREVLENMNLATWPIHIQINGGGTKSALWMRILASVLNSDLEVVSNKATPSYGAALLAHRTDYSSDLEEEQAEQGILYTPDNELVKAYDKQYQKYKRIYGALHEIMQE